MWTCNNKVITKLGYTVDQLDNPYDRSSVVVFSQTREPRHFVDLLHFDKFN